MLFRSIPVTRPWHAALSILAEQVARGVKPLANLTVMDTDLGEVELFMREFDRGRLIFARKLYWNISSDSHGLTVHIFYDELVWRVYQDAIRMPNGDTKHMLLGFLFGYNMDDIISYIKYNR